MNQLVGDAGGFAVGHTVESKTKGIWLCREAVTATTAAGERVSMLFMDSEGLGASDKNVKQCERASSGRGGLGRSVFLCIGFLLSACYKGYQLSL